MKESTYGPKFEQAVKDSGADGISAGELYETVGSSRQAAYGWIRANERNLRVVGKSTRGGDLYVWKAAAPASHIKGGSKQQRADGVEVGSEFTVTRLRFVAGRMMATLKGDDIEIEAELS
jgi:hypothetical protein